MTLVIAFTDIARRQEILSGCFYRKIGENKLKTSLLSTKVSATASPQDVCPQPLQFRNQNPRCCLLYVLCTVHFDTIM